MKQSAKDIFKKRTQSEKAKKLVPYTHIYHGGAHCLTETRGFANPQNRKPRDLVVDASRGFITLWAQGVTLNWRFAEQSLAQFQDPEAVKNYVRTLFADALLAWGENVPVRFVQQEEPWDFEIVIKSEDQCIENSCVIASAFFPDAGQHELVLYPQIFEQSEAEQIESMAHELGHIFGLRHFFAQLDETDFPSEIYGTHSRFSIMNYGEDSRLTETDKRDLGTLYKRAWSGELTHLNGTPIRLMKPYSAYQPNSPSAGIFAKSAENSNT